MHSSYTYIGVQCGILMHVYMHTDQIGVTKTPLLSFLYGKIFPIIYGSILKYTSLLTTVTMCNTMPQLIASMQLQNPKMVAVPGVETKMVATRGSGGRRHWEQWVKATFWFLQEGAQALSWSFTGFLIGLSAASLSLTQEPTYNQFPWQPLWASRIKEGHPG